MNVKRLMTELSNQRPVFHSEGDFQFSLARLIQQKHPNAKIRLEYPYVNRATCKTLRNAAEPFWR